MAVTVNDTRGQRELAVTSSPPADGAVRSPTGEVVNGAPAEMAWVRATNTFHTIATGASNGRTVTPGDVFQTPSAHAEDLKRGGLAEDADAPESEAAPEPAPEA